MPTCANAVPLVPRISRDRLPARGIRAGQARLSQVSGG